jgi:cytochrome c peroxidase
MRFKPECDHGANAGLAVARDVLDKVKAKYPEISYGDLWTLAGVVAVEEMGGPKIKWAPGRSDAASGTACPVDGRLPDASQGAQHVRNIFYNMGFNDQEIVALAGAHCFGRCHPTRSGYDGPWTRAPTTFSNHFFKELLENKWTKKNWSGPIQYEDPERKLMMLPADMAFIEDPVFRKHVEAYAKDEKLFEKDFAKAYSKLLALGVGGKTTSGDTKFPMLLAGVIGVAALSRVGA